MKFKANRVRWEAEQEINVKNVAIEGLRGRIFKAFSAHLFAYGVRLANRLCLPPLFLSAWGTAAYGEWLSLTSFLFFFSLTDVGGRYFLNNALTMAIAEKRFHIFKRYLAATLTITVALSLLSGGIYLTFFQSTSFSSAFVTLLTIQFICMALEQILTSAFRAIGLAHQGIALANFAELTQVIAAGILLFHRTPAGTQFALCYLLPHVAVVVVGFALLRWKTRRPCLQAPNAATLQETFLKASPFFSTILAEALALQGLLTLFSWICSAEEVASWGTLRTMVNVAFIVQTSLSFATWPELVRLKQRAGELFRIQVRSTIFMCGALLLVLTWLGPFVYQKWLGGRIAFEPRLFGLLLLYTFINSFWSPFQKFCLVTEPISTVGRITLFASLLTVLLATIGGKLYGPVGFTLGMITSDLLFSAWYFPLRIRKRVGEVQRELSLAGVSIVLLTLSYFFHQLWYVLFPLSVFLVWKEHIRLKRLAATLAVLLVLWPALARADDFFHVVHPAKKSADTCKQVQNALGEKQVGIVALAPGVDFKVDCEIAIPDNRTLWIPASTTVTQMGKGSLFTISGTGQILGNGTLRAPPLSFDSLSPRSGILITGSEATVQVGKIENFEYGVQLLGADKGCAYNEVRVRKIVNTLQGVKLHATGSGWVNQNYIQVNRIAHSLRDSHPLIWANSYGIFIDSESPHAPNANRFSGSIENVRYGIRLAGLNNRLDGLRLELEGRADTPAIRLLIAQTTFSEKSCDNKTKPLKGCVATQDNWWFGEWGKIKEGDIVATEGFKKFEGTSLNTAIQGFGVTGLKSLVENK